MASRHNAIGIEISPKFVGALFTERVDNTLRVFCFYTNGGVSQFDMPAQENLDNLHEFFSKLNMEETCTSLINDEVVQGRIYIQSEEGRWLYTLLSTPGDVLPPFNTHIHNLPWQTCWQSQEADILRYGEVGDPVHCYAIRTQISEGDAARLMKHSKAFTNPVSIEEKKPQRWFHLYIGIAIAALAVLIGLTLYYNHNKRHGVILPARPAATAPAVGEPTVTVTTGYYLLHNHQISGPYGVKVIADMRAGGLLDAATLCRPENSTDWVSLTNQFPATTPK